MPRSFRSSDLPADAEAIGTALLDAFEAGVQERRERQVRVTGRVGAADIGARGLLVPRLVERDADQSRAVPPRPGGVDGRLVARHEPLVGVHPLREDGRDLTCVPELARD